MRIPGAFLIFVGLIGTIVGLLGGCNAMFGWNGRHQIAEHVLPEAETMNQPLPVWGGRRYTLAVQVAFDRSGAAKNPDGTLAVEAKLPLTVHVKDGTGTTLAEARGWLDPSEPPNVLYGHTAHESMRGPTPELLVERLIGPFAAASDAPLKLDVTLGEDRVGKTKITARRLVIHDDVLPPQIRNAFVLAGTSAVALVAGILVLSWGWIRTRRRIEKKL